MHDSIETAIGYVVIDSDGESVRVTFKPTVAGEVRHEVRDGDGGHVSVYTMGKTPPKPMQEITQNGSTFEVLGVRKSGSGYDVLNGNTKTWEKWVED